MLLVRTMGRNVQTWDPLGDMIEQLSASKAENADPDLKLTSMSHADCLALRALSRCGQNSTRAITLLQECAAEACDRRETGPNDYPMESA